MVNVMTEELWNELRQCMNKYCIVLTPQDRYAIDRDLILRFDVNPYSPFYEPMIKQAVQYKREGNYEEAIRCYIKIFNEAKCFNTEIVRYLCKVLICDGELILAFRFLGAAFCELKIKCGPCPNPYAPSIPWAQFDDMDRLVRACFNFVHTQNIKTFCAYAAPIAGDPNYSPKCDPALLLMQAYRIITP